MEAMPWQPPVQGKLKLKMKRRKSFNDRPNTSAPEEGKVLSPLTNILNGGPKRCKSTTSKRRNPFQSITNENKRLKTDDSQLHKKDFSLFRISQENVVGNVRDYDMERLQTLERSSSKALTDSECKENSRTPTAEKHLNKNCSAGEIPTDWTLKTKLKFRSDTPFSWCTSLKTKQSVQGLVDFVRCNNSNESNFEKSKDEERLKIDFKKSLSSWIHPNLPFIPSFPVSDSVLKNGAQSICKDEKIQSSLMKSWSHSFQSLFTLTKCGFCPYFYFCCQMFTGLFVTSGLLNSQMVAVITPTTKGFREMLQNDDIEFEMPLHQEKLLEAEEPAKERNEIELENDLDLDKENIDKENEDEDFLASLGLNQKNFSSIRERKIADEITRLHSIDRRPKSTIVVRGANVNALFNFLVNSDVILAQSGPYEGVPPTLVAPVAFEGASLKMLKCVQGPMKFQDKGCMKQVYGLELTGPILPTQFYNICNIVKQVQKGFEASVASHGASSALNCLQVHQDGEDRGINSIYSSNYGIDEETFDHIKKAPLVQNGSIVKLTLQDGQFEWKMNNL